MPMSDLRARRRSRRFLPVILCGAILGIIPRGLVADEPSPRPEVAAPQRITFPESFTFASRCVLIPNRIPPYGGRYTGGHLRGGYLLEAARPEGGRLAAEFTILYGHTLEALGRPRAVDRYELTYPKLHEGDLFPLLGALYRVHRLSDGAGPHGEGSTLEVRRVAAGDLPPGLRPQVDLYAIPSGGILDVDGHHIVVETIPAPTDDQARPGARVGIYNTYAGLASVEAEVHVGSILRNGGRAYKVIDIVPPDSEHQVVGWVELAQTPLED